MALYGKDPQAWVDHEMDWSGRFAGRTISDSLWSVSPAEAGGLGVEEDGIDGLVTRARIGGGVVGRIYRLTNRVTLSDGQAEERSDHFRVEER